MTFCSGNESSRSKIAVKIAIEGVYDQGRAENRVGKGNEGSKGGGNAILASKHALAKSEYVFAYNCR